ncbi:hypothetical protein CRG98_049470, partial [Punica granatum]
ESNEPNLAPCRARSKLADLIFPELPRLSSTWVTHPQLQTESSDSHGRVPDSFPLATRL